MSDVASLDLEVPDVRHERDGAWYFARLTTPKAGSIVTGSGSKESFADAERMLRKMQP